MAAAVIDKVEFVTQILALLKRCMFAKVDRKVIINLSDSRNLCIDLVRATSRNLNSYPDLATPKYLIPPQLEDGIE